MSAAFNGEHGRQQVGNAWMLKFCLSDRDAGLLQHTVHKYGPAACLLPDTLCEAPTNTAICLLCRSRAGMASAAVKDRLNRLGQGVLQPSAGLAALAAVLRSCSRLTRLAGPSVVTVNPFKWDRYLEHMQVLFDSRNVC